VKYEVVGGTSDTEVGILVVSEGIEAQVADGVIKVTNNNKTATTGRVVAYAADHKGKSDIKTLVFLTEPSDEPAEFTAVIDGGVEEIVAEGGTFYLSVKADEDYTVSSDVDWIVVSQPTRALYEDRLAITVQENPTTEPRTGNITLRSKESDLLFAIEVKQAAGEEPQPVSGYESFLGAWNLNGGSFLVTEYLDEDGKPVEGYYEFDYSVFDEFICTKLFEAETQPLPIPAGYAEFDSIGSAMYFWCASFLKADPFEFALGAVDDGDYMELGGPDYDKILAAGVINEDGSVTIFGNEYDAVYDGTTYHEVIVTLTVFGYLAEEWNGYEPGWYSFKDMPEIALPATLTPATVADMVKNVQNTTDAGLEITPVKVRQQLAAPRKAFLRK